MNEMNFRSDSHNSNNTECSRELEAILDALAEISVQIRQVLQMSKGVVLKLEMHSQTVSPSEAVEVESRKRAIIANTASTEESIDHMNREISALLRVGEGAMLSDKSQNATALKSRKPSLRPVLEH